MQQKEKKNVASVMPSFVLTKVASRNGTRIWIEIIFFSVIFSENEFFWVKF